MAKYKIVQDIDKCLGCGACSSVCSNWQANEDGKYVPQKVDIDEKDCDQKAVEVCPVQCIKIEDVK